MPTFPRTESLKSRAAMDRLFGGQGQSLSAWPLRAVWLAGDGEAGPLRMMVSVGKRHFRHAVDRNRAKRQVRESYRLAKEPLARQMAAQGQSLDIAFIWLSDTHIDSRKVGAAMGRLLARIAEKCKQ